MQTGIWIQELTKMGHEVVVSSLLGSRREHDPVERDHDSPWLRARVLHRVIVSALQGVNPDLVITLGDIWVLDPNLLREMPVAHWLPGDSRRCPRLTGMWRRLGRLRSSRCQGSGRAFPQCRIRPLVCPARDRHRTMEAPRG